MKKILSHELIGGASLIFVGGFLANVFNFFFNVFMTRNLTIAEYGILASLISLMNLMALPANAVIPTVTQFGASYFAKGELHMVRGLFFRVVTPLFCLGIISFLLLIFFGNEIGHFFNIRDTSLISLAGFIIAVGFLSVVNTALLQGKLAFAFITIITMLGAFLKFSLGLVLVFLGFGLGGTMWSLFLAGFLPYMISFIPLRFIFQKGITTPKVSGRMLLSFGIPSAVASFALLSFINTDIILVKHFFTSENAGIYAGLSLVGRVIFFFSAPVSTVMFPLIAQKHTKEENYHNIFKLSLLLVFISCLFLTAFYFVFPEFVIRFFIKQEAYLVTAGLLGIFAFFITVFSLLTIITNFYLSVKRTEVAIPLIFGAVMQVVFIWVYHQTFLQIITISLIITSLLLILLLLYYAKLYVKKSKS